MQITLNLITAILIGIAIFVLANFLGLLEGRNQGYKKRKKEEAGEPKPAPLPPPSPPVTDNSLLKLSLDENNQPRLALDGQRVDTSQLAPEQRKRLIDLMVMMRPWIDAAPARPAAAPRPMAAQTSSLSQPRPTPLAAASVSQPKSTPIAAAPAPPSEEEAAPTSMVGQIDVILQRMLIGTPLASLGVRLIESPQGGVTVMVGANKYAGVGDVPDPQAQAVIRAAIAEWEKKYTPGV